MKLQEVLRAYADDRANEGVLTVRDIYRLADRLDAAEPGADEFAPGATAPPPVDGVRILCIDCQMKPATIAVLYTPSAVPRLCCATCSAIRTPGTRFRLSRM